MPHKWKRALKPAFNRMPTVTYDQAFLLSRKGQIGKKKSVNKKMPILNYLLSDLRDHSDLMKTSLY